MAKKSIFGDVNNPAELFISKPAQDTASDPGEAINREERKTKRLQLLLTPSSVDSARILSNIRGISLNELIQQAINREVQENAEQIEQFTNMYRK